MEHHEFISFGSGSSGNCYWFRTKDNRQFLIDAGVGIRRLSKMAICYGLNLQNLEAILVTHEHIDHVRCVEILSFKYNIPIYAIPSVWQGMKNNPVVAKRNNEGRRFHMQPGQSFSICGLRVTAFNVPHDTLGNVGYYITDDSGNLNFVLATDVGRITPEIEDNISKATHLVLESNYDLDMLRNGKYPYHLQQRICSGNGHLENSQAAELVLRHRHHLKNVWFCHLSENNNTPQKTMQTFWDIIEANGIDKKEIPEVITLNRTEPSGFFVL